MLSKVEEENETVLMDLSKCVCQCVCLCSSSKESKGVPP